MDLDQTNDGTTSPENKLKSDKVAEAVTRLKGMKEKFSKVGHLEASESNDGRQAQPHEQTDASHPISAQPEIPEQDKNEPPRHSHDQDRIDDTLSVPLARVKRIIRQDDQIMAISSGASYSVAAAVELFIKYMAEQAYVCARANKRKKIQYNDLAIAIQRQPELEFLSVLVPRTVPYKAIRERVEKRDENSDPLASTAKGKQSTITFAPKEAD